ncbi:hypothetical protein DFH08DRAFT_287127 [Mycena albidolilacea]|uniref:Serine hydrolase domain-containing protein n=1 Tax=Mycena albidolilacea TaxID=1033008 RepID=A0AAD6ZRU8_9AGAR|nr:hypothetical protein DFH08DRAFT_287127 [Mycena albidolilacea]
MLNIFVLHGFVMPWWLLCQTLEVGDSRWEVVVSWWSTELSERQYDGIIGLSQGSAMAVLLLSMVNHPERVPGFSPAKKQDIKFGIFCSGVLFRTLLFMRIYMGSLIYPPCTL